jgi:hypothetical protein
MDDALLKFVWKFFKNLGATLSMRNEILTASNIPEKFEKFFGKKSPYKFTVDESLATDEVEFLEKGSYTLKAISSYLEGSGETTLLKIDFKCDPESEVKKRIDLKNSTIVKLSQKKRNNIFFRYTFHTSFQYLNEREKLINEVYIHDNKRINGDLNDYPVSEGSKSEIEIPDMKESYFVAKEDLKVQLDNKTREVANKLNTALELEIRRVEAHFETEERELKYLLEKAKERFEETVREGDQVKISRQAKVIDSIKEKLNPEERLNDKERSILIEKTKHGLNVNNKLFNTTLIYHPIYTYDFYVKNEHMKTNFEVAYDPLTKSLQKIPCSICHEDVREIYFCSNGHLACRKCMVACKSCGKEHCKKCLKIHCELCDALICDSCKVRCIGCGKLMCKSHTTQDKLSRRHYCNTCLTKCERCASLKIGSDFRRSRKTGVKVCEDCYRKEIQEKIVRNLD